jgi:hypothetical protein
MTTGGNGLIEIGNIKFKVAVHKPMSFTHLPVRKLPSPPCGEGPGVRLLFSPLRLAERGWG